MEEEGSICGALLYIDLSYMRGGRGGERRGERKRERD